jgi:hypothetical protein
VCCCLHFCTAIIAVCTLATSLLPSHLQGFLQPAQRSAAQDNTPTTPCMKLNAITVQSYDYCKVFLIEQSEPFWGLRTRVAGYLPSTKGSQ